ncbi:energy transducer TonB [Aquabacterium sp. CECT 9606]|uniref:energy transducer TonB n=1 Tax=Aquabacterium sp. CECT 9606 TaxID=2845822 RepID=UPI001E4EC131|nr:energy transducer TonB [Aquabacterium sp. CECT 9606]CAH0347817.1 hypothetical protein AQB9606_00036 [Aquabacterium sp. CECT 9606]
MNQRLSTCVVMVVALHGAVLAWANRPADGTAQAMAQSGHAVQVRMLSAASVPPSSSRDVTANALATSDASLGGAADTPAQDVDSAIDLDGYVPRRWLTVAPRPTAPVLLPFPSDFNDNAHYTVVLNLYIEADGRVGRIEFEGVPLPDLLARAARSTFENARFTPGQVKGRIVKSLIRVEVDFDNLAQG